MTEPEFVYVDPRDVYGDELDSWTELWDFNATLYQNVYNIATQAVILPRHEQQMPLAVTYLCVPTKWAKVIGLLFSYGQKGSGKTTFADLAVRLHPNAKLSQPGDTYASLRNALNERRWIDRDTQEQESEGAILAWDNLRSEVLERNVDVYNLLLCGYSRASEVTSIAGKDGRNIEFKTFCPKILSSVDPLHLNPDFSELLRRIYLIEHKPYELFNKIDKEGIPEGFDIVSDRLELDSIDWAGLPTEFLKFWNNPENHKLYAQYRKMLTKRGKKPVTLTPSMTGARWTISVDLIVTGLVTGAWTNPQDAVTYMCSYWEWFDDYLKGGSSATKQLLQDFISEQAKGQLAMYEVMLEQGITNPPKPVIQANILKTQLDIWQREGQLDITPRTRDVGKLMGELGWRLTKRGWEKI
jgi:hypothetical protein